MCSGSIILAAAGLLNGKRATSHWMALPMLKTLGRHAVGDQRVVHEGDIVTSAGVSAGIDLALWLAGQIGGDDRAKVIQLSMEYDPQPPFDSGHMSKASAKTKAAATALMARDVAKPAQLKAGTLLLWNHALAAARANSRRYRPLSGRPELPLPASSRMLGRCGGSASSRSRPGRYAWSRPGCTSTVGGTATRRSRRTATPGDGDGDRRPSRDCCSASTR